MVGLSYGPDRLWASHSRRDLPIGPGLTKGDGLQGTPDLPLKGRASLRGQGEGKGCAAARQILQ